VGFVELGEFAGFSGVRWVVARGMWPVARGNTCSYVAVHDLGSTFHVRSLQFHLQEPGLTLSQRHGVRQLASWIEKGRWPFSSLVLQFSLCSRTKQGRTGGACSVENKGFQPLFSSWKLLFSLAQKRSRGRTATDRSGQLLGEEGLAALFSGWRSLFGRERQLACRPVG